jgi:transcriptional regulator with XRE-family HTH domain
MGGFDPVAFGERLREELDLKGWDVKAFQQKVAAKVPGNRMGTSYGSIWSYVNDQAPQEPRRETVEAMASLLGVRPDYLLFGGPRTETDVRAAQHSEAAIAEERIDPVLEIFIEHFPGSGRQRPHHGPGPAAEAMLWRLHSSVEMAGSDLAHLEGREWRLDEDKEIEIAHQMVRALLAPLKELDALPPRLVEPGRRVAESGGQFHAGMVGPPLDDYLIGACEVLRGVIERQRRSIQFERRNRRNTNTED